MSKSTEEIIAILEEIKNVLPRGSVKWLKVEIAKAIFEASEDISTLSKGSDIEGIARRMQMLCGRITEIRSDFVVGNFPSGGIHEGSSVRYKKELRAESKTSK